MINKMEILAPAGGMESFYAAVACGANGVYLGSTEFSARASAHNFDMAQLKTACDYAHNRDVRVYLTLNTVLFSKAELDRAGRLIFDAVNAGVDAFIVQDLGAVRLIREISDTVEIHASTQMSIATIGGAKIAKQLGITRVVLARELSEKEIAEFKDCGVEIECFVHGAQCMSVSGQCFLSATIGGRSANRGRCAGSCRLPFENDCLSLRDMSLVSKVKQLSDIGVCSLKIEGRMRRPEYVAAAVTALKSAIEGKKIDFDMLKAAYCREDFTSGYFDGSIGKNMFGIRTKQDVLNMNEALPKISQLYNKPVGTVPVTAKIKIALNQQMIIILSDGKFTVTATGDIPQQAKTKDTTAEQITESIAKFGDTPYYLKGIEVDIQSGVFVAKSQLNALRRQATELLKEKRIYRKVNTNSIIIEEYNRNYGEKPTFRAVFVKAPIEYLPEFAEFEYVAVPLKDYKKFAEYKNVIPRLPRMRFGSDGMLKKQLVELAPKAALIGSINDIPVLNELGIKILGDFSLNIANGYSANEFAKLGVKEITLSPEIHIRKIAKEMEKAEKIGTIIYGKMPIMVTRNCPKKDGSGMSCGDRKNCKITDRKGYEFDLICDGFTTEMLNCHPIYNSDRLNEFSGADFLSFYFTNENSYQIKQVIADYKTNAKPRGEYTRGIYYKTVE